MDVKASLSITLLAEEWNVVLDVLNDGRYRAVAPLIQKIVEQANEAEKAAQVPRLHPVVT